MGAKSKRHWLLREMPLHLMLLPAVILTLIFRYIPFAGLSMAFQSYNPASGLFDQIGVGFDNFTYLFSIRGFYGVLWNTVLIAVMKIIGNLVVPIAIALLLNEMRNRRYKGVLQTIYYLPHFLSWVALSGVLLDVLSPSGGFINQALKSVGIEPVFFLGDPKVFPYTMVATDVWKEFGWGSIVYLAAITGIDPSPYEAAVVDGAGKWKQVLRITLPSIAPIVMLMMVLSIGNIMQAGFDQIVNLYSAQVYDTGDILDTFIYRIGVVDAQFGLATAVGLLKSIVSMILILVGYRVADRVAGYRVF